MKYILQRTKRFCGFVTGFVFFLSGIIKLLDPVGAGLVMDGYFDFLHLGFMEPDADYSEFITMGAKKYAYRYTDGKLGITVAGVNKKKGAEELEAAGGLSAFKEGFTFYKAGGTESVYNDHPEITSIIREGREIPITANLLIKDSMYTLGITAEYSRILQRAEIWREIFIKKW